jgi:hypothetical protein
MNHPETPRHIEIKDEDDRIVEIKDEDDRVVAEAEVTTARGPEGTVRTSMQANNATARRGDRTTLVDAVMDLPEVQASERVEASVPYGDGETLERLRQRTDNPQTRVAGATTLLDANVPPQTGPADRSSTADSPGAELIRGGTADEIPVGGEPADDKAGE